MWGLWCSYIKSVLKKCHVNLGNIINNEFTYLIGFKEMGTNFLQTKTVIFAIYIHKFIHKMNTLKFRPFVGLLIMVVVVITIITPMFDVTQSYTQAWL